MDIIRQAFALNKAIGNSDIREQQILASRLIASIQSVQKGQAEENILNLLKSRSGHIVTSQDIRSVTGVSDPMRIIRKLRAMGWKIVTGTNPLLPGEKAYLKKNGVDIIKNGEYVLISRYKKRLVSDVERVRKYR